MDYSELPTSLQNVLGENLPNILGALAILVIGWLFAVAARAGARRLLSLLGVNARIREGTDQSIDLENGIAVAAFWVILLVTVIAILNVLNLELASNPFQVLANEIFGYVPRLIAGSALVLTAWLVATLLRAGASKLLGKTKLDDSLSTQAGMEPMSKNAGNVLFWLVILLFIPAILGAFNLEGLLAPVQSMLNKVLVVIPDVFAAVLIGFVGWLLAKVMRGLITNLLAASGIDRAGHAAGLDSSVSLSRVAGSLVFLFIFVPSLIGALDALNIEAISKPATEMLTRILNAIPHLVAAGLILVITYYVAKFASALISRLLASVGIDALPAKVGIAQAFGDWKVSTLAGRLLLFFAMLFATTEAANQLEFTQVRDLVTTFVRFGADVLLGAAILLIGFTLANLAHAAILKASGENIGLLARIARLAILGLVIAMGLRAMGIADDIVNIAFGLTLGAVAVAVALSFGLGGRDAAGRQMEYWLSKLRKDG
jgi:hypothetical protein